MPIHLKTLYLKYKKYSRVNIDLFLFFFVEILANVW